MPIPDAIANYERRTLGEIALEQIRDAIFDGTLTPGEALNDEELEQWLGCSRTPLRQAMKELTSLGLVDTVAQRYTRVAAPTGEDRADIAEALTAVAGGLLAVTVPQLTETQRSSASTALDEGSWSSLRAALAMVCDAIPNKRLGSARDQTIALAHLLAAASPDSEPDTSALGDAIARGDGQESQAALSALLLP